MSEIKWVKITTDIFDNRKIKHLRHLPDGNAFTLIWVMMLTTAGRCNAGGRLFLTESIPYTADMLASEFGFEESLVESALKLFRQLNMIAKENGVFRIAGWDEYQNADRLAEIRAKDRERKRTKRAQEKNNRAESEEPSSDLCGYAADTDGQDADTYGRIADIPRIEEEKEEEKEKEFHSFFRSAQTEQENFIEKKVAEAGFDGEEADAYRAELRENLRLRYFGGELGQDVVLMSMEQFDDLCGRLSLDEIEKYFAIVAECEKNGKRYKKKSHYQAILDMASRDRRIETVP